MAITTLAVLLLAAAPESRVKELQKERVGELRAASEVSVALAKNGRLELSEALDDRVALLKAELEVAGTPSERVDLCRKAVDSLKGTRPSPRVRRRPAAGPGWRSTGSRPGGWRWRSSWNC